MLITCVPNFKFKRFTHKKILQIYQLVLMQGTILPLPISLLQTSEGLKICGFVMNFFLHDQPYVKKMYTKFQVQNIHLQKNIQNLPLCSCKGQLPTSIYKLVDLMYHFVGESFELEI